MSDNFGYKRTVVGAHYGLRDWLSQRVTAVLMALFTLILRARHHARYPYETSVRGTIR